MAGLPPGASTNSVRKRGMISSIVNPPNVDSRSRMSITGGSSVRGSFMDYVSDYAEHEGKSGGFTDALREGTILNQDITQRLKEAQPETITDLQSNKGVILQLVVFFLYVFIQGLHPNLSSSSKKAVVNGETHKIIPYLNGVFMATSNVVTLVLMWIIALLMDGFRGFRRCFDAKSIFAMAPPGILYAIGDIVQLAAYDAIDPTLAAIISQFRMLYSALLFRWFVKKKLTSVQWMQLVVVFLLVLVYFRVTMKVTEVQNSLLPGGGGKKDKGTATMVLGVLLMVVRVAITGPANVLSYVVFQAGDLPFYAQMAHSQMTAIPSSLLVGLLEIQIQDKWEYFPFKGISCEASIIDPNATCYWTWNIYLLLVWFAFRQVFTCLILKVLDVIWKGISDVMGVLCTFIFAITIFGQLHRDNNDLLLDIRLTIILAICLATISYILSKAKSPPPVSQSSESLSDSEYTGNASPVQGSVRSPPPEMLDGKAHQMDELDLGTAVQDNLSKPLLTKH